jgi:hypothetical protein
MSLNPNDSKAALPKIITPADKPRTATSVKDGYSSQEDDAPTRVFTKKETFSPDTLPEMVRATTKEREKEFFVRDFGDKVSPTYDDVRRQAGIRVDSVPMGSFSGAAPLEASNSDVKVMEITHNWTQQVQDNEFVATINVLDKKSASSAGSEGRIVWM